VCVCLCCVFYSRKDQKSSWCCFFFVVCVCVFLAQVFEKDSDTHTYVLYLFYLCVCVFYANKLSLSNKKQIVRFQHITRSFCCFFLAFCFIVHTGLFFLSLSLSHFIREKLCISFLFCFVPISFCCFCFGLTMIMYMVCIL
jgi:hypothetical protein